MTMQLEQQLRQHEGGSGVAFAAVPFLGFFMPDLVRQVQPRNSRSTVSRSNTRAMPSCVMPWKGRL